MNAIENGMVIDASYPERPADWVCPNCGEEWMNDEITISTKSDAGQYCQCCVMDALDTEANRLKWFDGQSADYAGLLGEYIIQQHGYGAPTKIADGVNARGLLEFVKADDADGYSDALHDFIHSDDTRRWDYRDWLMATN